MKRKTVSEYPTRYSAHANPGTLILAEDPKKHGGYEAAVYSNSEDNLYWPGVRSDGVYGSVTWHAGRQHWHVEVQATTPDRRRLQKTSTSHDDDLELAIGKLEALVDSLEEWVAAKTEAL